MRSLLTSAAIVLVTGLVGLPAVARAHPLIDDAAAALRRADYEEALTLLERCEGGDGLSRDEAIELLLLRARVHHAAGSPEDVEVEMFRLAHLAPELELGPEVPPAIARSFEQALPNARPLAARATAQRTPDGVRIEASVRSDVAGLSRGFRIHARPDGESWTQSDDPLLELALAPERAVDYWAEVLGPGGAPIARAGSPEEPSRLAGTAESDAGGGDDLPWWPFLVSGAVVLVGVVIGVALALTLTTDDTDIVFPAPQALRF